MVAAGCTPGSSDAGDSTSGNGAAAGASSRTTTPGEDGSASPDTDDDSTGDVGLVCPDDPSVQPRYELGWEYLDGYEVVEDGDPLTIVIGWQGAWMVPFGVRAEGFCVPADPFDYDKVPQLDARIDDILGISEFPVSFVTDDPEASLSYAIVPLILPDAVDPYSLEGQPATLTSELRVGNDAPLHFRREVTLTVSD